MRVTGSSEEERRLAKAALEQLEPLADDVAKLTANGHEVLVPQQALVALVEMLQGVAEGDEVTVVRTGREVSTEEAALLLNVSRPTVVRMIEGGALPARKVGRHRRLLLQDVLAVNEREQRRREAALERFLNTA